MLQTAFIHGEKDTFATSDELDTAVRAISGPTYVTHVPGVGHDLAPDRTPVGPFAVELVGKLLG